VTDIQATLQAGIAATRAGNRAEARQLLQEVITADPNNEQAWLWLASNLSRTEDRVRALERVLKINPNNERAQVALQRLNEKRATGTLEKVAPPPSEPRSTYTPPPSPPRPVVAPTTPTPRVAVANPPRRTLRIAGVNAYFLVAGGLLTLMVFYGITQVISAYRPPLTQREIENAATQVAGQIFFPTDIPTLTPTLTPTFAGIIVTQGSAPTLPPTFTPTNEPTFTPTRTPSPTPEALSIYEVVYAGATVGSDAYTLYRMRADGSQQTALRIVTDHYAVSADGRLLAWVGDASAEEGGQALYVASMDTPSDATELTQTTAPTLSAVTWSPDGKQLAYVQDDTQVMRVSITSTDAPVRLEIGAGTSTKRDLAWSPNGESIAFAADEWVAGVFEIYTVELATNRLNQLTEGQGNNLYPSWSPNGIQLAFISDRNGDNDVYIMDANGGGSTLITADDKGAEDVSPSWSGDGKYLAFASNRLTVPFQLYLVDVRGISVQCMTQDDRNNRSPIFVATMP